MSDLANTMVVFDLDDTLYKERDFVRSGYQAVAHYVANTLKSSVSSEQIFDNLWKSFNEGDSNAFKTLFKKFPSETITAGQLVEIYRLHQPLIELLPDAREVIEQLRDRGALIGLLTDGRSVTQRNKLSALDITSLLDQIVISEEIGSEKPAECNYRIFMDKSPATEFVYVGDNQRKDFVTPNRLGWLTVQLLDYGVNIHSQAETVALEFRAQQSITHLNELTESICKVFSQENLSENLVRERS